MLSYLHGALALVVPFCFTGISELLKAACEDRLLLHDLVASSKMLADIQVCYW